MKKRIYLGGPIRKNEDGSVIKKDREWRNQIKEKLHCFFDLEDPVDNNNTSNQSSMVFAKDSAMIRMSDYGVFLLDAFFEDLYPCIGGFVEIGMFISTHRPVFIICDPKFGFRLKDHPMLKPCVFFDNIDSFIEEMR